MLSNEFPVNQAFSYLSGKKNVPPPRKKQHETLVILALFVLLCVSLRLHIPQQWLYILQTHFPAIFLSGLFFFLIILKSLVAMEIITYITHRYIEHPNFLTRYSAQVRQNQQAHWFHHMIHYPGNASFQRLQIFKRPQLGKIPRHWVFPLACFTVFSILLNGFTKEVVILLLGSLFHCKMMTWAHRFFHLKTHFLSKNRYFQWLTEIHLLHHFDQRTNFMMLNPWMDILFGTYLSPRGRFSHIKTWLHEHDLNASDFINWHYLLTEANPDQYAIFISSAHLHPEPIQKATRLVQCLQSIEQSHPFYQDAYTLKSKLQVFLENTKTHVKCA